VLLDNREAGGKQFKRQRIFVDLFQESRTKRVEHGKRAADHATRQFVQPVTIRVFCVHLLGICVSSLPLRRCRRMVTEVLTGPRCATCGERSYPAMLTLSKRRRSSAEPEQS
jgi:hypothetical protein